MAGKLEKSMPSGYHKEVVSNYANRGKIEITPILTGPILRPFLTPEKPKKTSLFHRILKWIKK